MLAALDIGRIHPPAVGAHRQKRLADGPPVAYRLAKQNLRAGVGGTMAEALARETEAQVQCLQTKDAMNAARSFFMKQTPTFEGK